MNIANNANTCLLYTSYLGLPKNEHKKEDEKKGRNRMEEPQ